MSRLTVFFIVSLFLVYFSKKSFARLRSHGFYRFFAWESILAIVMINDPHWFEDPFSIQHIVSWLFLGISVYLVVHGIYLLKTEGKPSKNRNDEELLAFEKTTQLVSVGIYKYIRHPLYSSLLFLAWGAFLKEISVLSLCLVFMTSLFLILTAKSDESECLRYFGGSYQTYKLKTKMFIPYIF